MSKEELRETAFKAMRVYILEECAVLLMLSKDEREFEYEFYRGERNAPMKFVHRELVTPGRMVAIPVLDAKENRNESYTGSIGNKNNLFKALKSSEETQSNYKPSSIEMNEKFGSLKFLIKMEPEGRGLTEFDFKIMTKLLSYIRSEVSESSSEQEKSKYTPFYEFKKTIN